MDGNGAEGRYGMFIEDSGKHGSCVETLNTRTQCRVMRRLKAKPISGGGNRTTEAKEAQKMF